MRITSFRRVKREDLKGAPPWAGRIVDPMNEFFTTVFRALNRQLTFEENLASDVRRGLPFKADGSGDVVEFEFAAGLRKRVLGVLLLQATDRATGLPVAAGPIAWREVSGQVVVSAVGGLSANGKYRGTFLVF